MFVRHVSFDASNATADHRGHDVEEGMDDPAADRRGRRHRRHRSQTRRRDDQSCFRRARRSYRDGGSSGGLDRLVTHRSVYPADWRLPLAVFDWWSSIAVGSRSQARESIPDGPEEQEPDDRPERPVCCIRFDRYPVVELPFGREESLEETPSFAVHDDAAARPVRRTAVVVGFPRVFGPERVVETVRSASISSVRAAVRRTVMLLRTDAPRKMCCRYRRS